jgi:hypothetical protein
MSVTWHQWPNTSGMSVVFIEEDDCVICEPEAEKKPEVPPECWNDRPISGEVCMQAVRQMSKGG